MAASHHEDLVRPFEVYEIPSAGVDASKTRPWETLSEVAVEFESREFGAEPLEARPEEPPFEVREEFEDSQVTLRLADLIDLWDVGTALNHRIRRMVVQVLDRQPRTPVASCAPAICLERPRLVDS